jgi:hypothetical protein
MICLFTSDQSCIVGDPVDHAWLAGGREAAARADHVGTTYDTGMTTIRTAGNKFFSEQMQDWLCLFYCNQK